MVRKKELVGAADFLQHKRLKQILRGLPGRARKSDDAKCPSEEVGGEAGGDEGARLASQMESAWMVALRSYDPVKGDELKYKVSCRPPFPSCHRSPENPRWQIPSSAPS